jgi:UDPglucose--hexose-1-phosphate uridylyltransferase
MSSRKDHGANESSAEIRRDLRGEAVIVSPGRAHRPNDFRDDSQDRGGNCPFCPGHEGQTPPETDAFRGDGSAPDSPGWSVRVVPNRYPAFPREPAGETSAWGVHEVIIETPEHDLGLADLPPEQVERVLAMYQRRLTAAKADGRLAFASIFKNHGPEAGASLEHSHAQLMAVPFVPRRIAEEVEAHRRGEFSERLAAARPVLESDRLKAFCPADARLPYEVWIAPKQPEPAFEDADSVVLREVAGMLGPLLGAMNAILDHPPYHLLVYPAPFLAGEGFCWRIELVPRLARIAGFELATGVFVNQTDSAEAGDAYRARLTQAGPGRGSALQG